MVDVRVKEWRAKFAKLQGGKEIVSLTGETSADLHLLQKGDVIVCTPAQVCSETPRFVSTPLIYFVVKRPIKTMAPTEERTDNQSPHRR